MGKLSLGKAITVAAGMILATSSVGYASTIFVASFNVAPAADWGNQRGNWYAAGGVYNAASPNNSPLTYTDVTTHSSLTNFVVSVDINNTADGGLWLRSNYNGGNINGVLLVTNANAGTIYWHEVVNETLFPSKTWEGSAGATIT